MTTTVRSDDVGTAIPSLDEAADDEGRVWRCIFELDAGEPRCWEPCIPCGIHYRRFPADEHSSAPQVPFDGRLR